MLGKKNNDKDEADFLNLDIKTRDIQFQVSFFNR